MTSEGRSDMMVSKILLVDEKWLEKQPPLVAVPKRPEDFDGVSKKRNDSGIQTVTRIP